MSNYFDHLLSLLLLFIDNCVVVGGAITPTNQVVLQPTYSACVFETVALKYGDGVIDTVEENSSISFLIKSMLVTISKGMQAVKLALSKSSNS